MESKSSCGGVAGSGTLSVVAKRWALLEAGAEHVAGGAEEIALEVAFGGEEIVGGGGEEGEENFLYDFFGGFDLAGHVEGEAEDGRLVAVVEREEGRLVAFGGEGEEIGVGSQGRHS